MGLGDLYKGIVMGRTGINPKDLKCPLEKSYMTPCVARDGDIALTVDGKCVGCGADVEDLIKEEKKKIEKQVKNND
jgi:hypothetical protein